MDKKIKLGISGATVFLSLLASAFFLKSSGLITTNFVNLTTLDSWLAFLLTPNIILLAVIFPVPLAIISALTHFEEKTGVYMVSFGGAIPAAVISLVLFGISFEKIVLSVFFLAGLLVLIESSFIKKSELKRYITFRTAAQSSKTAILIIAIGGFIAAGSIGFANNAGNVKVLGEKLIEFSFNQQSGTQELSEVLATSLINSQKQTVDAIMHTPQFQKLATKADPDVQAFVATMNATRENTGSPQMRGKVIEQIQNAQRQGSSGQPITFDFLRRQSPMIATIADYYWLINAFSLFTLLMFASNIVLSNLAGLYAAAGRRVIEATQIKVTL